MSHERTVTETSLNVWRVIGVLGIGFVLMILLNGGIAPWKNKVLFDCAPIGDGGYVQLDPTLYHPGCEYFGPSMNDR